MTQQVSLSGTRKGSGREKQQPPRASSCCVSGKKSPEDVMSAPQLTFKELYARLVQKWYKMAFLPPSIYISCPQKISFHSEIEPLAEHAECDLGQPMPTSDGESNPTTALCSGMVFPWGLSFSGKRKKKRSSDADKK